VIDELVAIRREVRAPADLVVEADDAGAVGRQEPKDEGSAALFTRSSTSVMLPLVSRATTTAMGWTSAANDVMAAGLLLSKTSKSSCLRSGTRRPLLSSTVA
jgi:hypothetical protein